MVQKGLSGAAENPSKFRPGVRGTHIDDTHRLYSWLWRFDTKEVRGLAAFDTAPELSLRSNDQVLVKRIGMGGDLDPFAAACDDREHRNPRRNHPHIVLQLG